MQIMIPSMNYDTKVGCPVIGVFYYFNSCYKMISRYLGFSARSKISMSNEVPRRDPTI